MNSPSTNQPVPMCHQCGTVVPVGESFCNDECRAAYWHIPVEDLKIKPVLGDKTPVNFAARMIRWKKEHQVRTAEQQRCDDKQMIRLHNALKENHEISD